MAFLISLSPLEQFELHPLFYFGGTSNFPFCFTNSALYMFFVSLTVGLLMFSARLSHISQVVPNAANTLLETAYVTVLNLGKQNIGEKGRIYFPFLFCIFTFILVGNIAGMFPYSFTVTSHISVTLGMAIIVFFGVNCIGIKKHKSMFFNLFLPSGSSFALALMLVPIELISYLFRVISLPVRLFANMMAGHTLLKVIVGFFWTLSASTGLLFLISSIPFGALTLLIGLEFAVAAIQSFVFTILACSYLNDAINLH
jgi:ATP synthase subunit 6